jgi:tRNA-specific 2-thiouridylase
MTDDTNRIAVAMSGGVDSSVTACLLLEKGFKVEGVFMALAQPDLKQQEERVKNLAERLGIPLRVIDLGREFRQCVLHYFVSSYFAGKTPNPCMICNPRIKFGLLLESVRAASFDRLATGHYVRLEKDREGRMHLLKGVDTRKDQSYFLSQLQQEQLHRLLFPLGGLRKKEVYAMAADFDIAGVHGKESQDVCFLEDTDVASFLEKAGKHSLGPGAIVDLEGKRLGVHKGIHRYTVGQRRGLGLPDATPYYVVGLDAATNSVIVGKKADLWRKEAVVRDMNWLAGSPPPLPSRFEVRIRYRHQPAVAEVRRAGSDKVHIFFEQQQRAITPGQFAVLYKEDEVIGGGELM